MQTSAQAEGERRFQQLLAEVRPNLERYLRRRTDPGTADDVLADVLAVMWRRAGEIPEDAALAWSYGVARGCLANERRRARRRLALLLRLRRERAPEPRRDADPELAEALAALPPADRELLALWAWEDLAPREIATVLGITPNAVSIRLHRATARLRQQYLGRPAGSATPAPDSKESRDDPVG